MRIRDLLGENSINLDARASGKEDALNQIIDLMAKSGKIRDVEEYKKGVFQREKESTTGIGMGVAIPHCKSDAVISPGLAAMVVKDGVDFESLDGEKAKVIFLIAAPNTKDNIHLQVLSKLSMMLIDENFTNSLVEAKSVEEFLNIIDEAENARDEKDGVKAATAPSSNKDIIEILAVTGCPTGIAHTYMAAEALENKAKEMGVSIKVETRGSGGAKNVLTDAEIENAKAIIVAADTKVPMERFDGKKVIECRVSDGINKSEELIKKALRGDVREYKAGTTKAEKSEGSVKIKSENNGIGHQIYTHLMNGVSHMLPFVIGGGIMIALAFLIDTVMGYGKTGGADFGTCTPLSALFKYIGGLAMGLMVPVLAGYIGESIADRPGLAVGFTGGLLAANGNALLFSGDAANYIFSDSQLGSFQEFIRTFAFQG